MYIFCTGCETPITMGEHIVIYNDNEYHTFCAEVAKNEVKKIFEERRRREILMEENSDWLPKFLAEWEFWKFDTGFDSNSNDAAYVEV